MNKLKEARQREGMSQLDLFIKSGIWPSRISNIENGHWIPFETERLKLANALGVEKGWLFPEE